MEAVTEQIDLKNIDKSDWQTYRFDEIAHKISERVDPNETELDTYVGLTHIDGEDVHIRRTGTSDDVKGTKLRFYPGDIIFGRRRAYQRKAALATCEGFCSAHALVLRANPEVIIPDLFPFFMHSDQFMHRAVDISVGSLSPTINWSKLKTQKFKIPPEEVQVQLAELFWALDQEIEGKKKVYKKTAKTRMSYFEDKHQTMKGIKTRLKDLLVRKNKKSKKPHKFEKYIGLEHIESGAFHCKDYAPATEANAQCNIVQTGDLCYSKLRPYLDKAFIAEFDAVSSTELLIFNTKSVTKEYILHHLHSPSFLSFISGKGYGTRMPRVNLKLLGKYEVKVLENEKSLLKKLSRFLENENMIKTAIKASKALQKSIINQIF